MHAASGFKPLLSLQFVAKPMLEHAVGLDSIASGTGQILGADCWQDHAILDGRPKLKFPEIKLLPTACRNPVRPFVIVVKGRNNRNSTPEHGGSK
jgi:hypothetical protein